MDEQVEFTEDIKPMLDTTLNRVRGIDGVAWAVPMFKNFVNAILPDGTRKNVRLIGLDDASLLGGPPVMVEGELEDLRRDGAVIVSAVESPLMLERTDGRKLNVGERFSINDNEVRIVGKFTKTKEFFWEPVVYTTFSRASFLAPRQRRTTMYVLVKLQPEADIKQVQALILKATGHKALTNKEFEAQTMSWIINKTGILVNFGITILLGFVIGLLVSGQTLFSFVLDNVRYFAAIKAMGGTNALLMRMVLIQVAVAGVMGYGIGLGVAAFTGQLLTRGGLAFEMPWQVPVFGAAAIVSCCGMAGALSLIRVFRLEPAVVFKS
jgi:putative ABC transport system permease protein